MHVLCLLIIASSVAYIYADSALGNNATVCDCGFVDENDNVWANIWNTNYDTYNTQLQHDSNYIVMDYTVGAKNNSSYQRVYDPDNVKVSHGSAQIFVENKNSGPVSGAFGTRRQDFLYGSYRAYFKITNEPGTVSAFYFYRNDTSEIDMELLSRFQSPWMVYFAIHPQLYNDDGSASNITNDKHSLSFDASEAYHEYRYDWTPGSVIFYVDGAAVRTMTTNIPSDPGRIIFSQWSDGNPNFSGGPPTADAIMSIANQTFFFNTSDTDQPLLCQQSQKPCPISDITSHRLEQASSNSTQSSNGDTSMSQSGKTSSNHGAPTFAHLSISWGLVVVSFVTSVVTFV